MKNKHTKGEWKVDEGSKSFLISSEKRSVSATWKNETEDEANAKLIAAAPDLLEAALDFVKKVEDGRARSTDSYQKFKAAIKKATE